ncbi:GroES-like protein [Glonium stellatum]|uniref:GroES-like protein n=1 Tax=Glonium stellatum TaxID=574774 RepID=A0A8E2EXP0_9PEZI|nr:GroES-like protein [Glonium stellatum]
MANEAAWIKSEKANLEVGPTEKYAPGPHDILIKTHAIAFNPLEASIQKLAIFPITYPAILGSSLAGTVEAVGSAVTAFQAGDRVAASRSPTTIGDKRYGAYQRFALAASSSAAKLDPAVSFADAVSVITNVRTAAAALSVYLGLEKPVLDAAAPPARNEKVLIYGGSSSLGALAVKYAVDAGYAVTTTSSAANRALVEGLGPKHVLDHTVGAEALGKGLVALGPFDANGGAGSWYTVLPSMGPESLPEGVERRFQSFSSVLGEEGNQELRRWLVEVYVPEGLKRGKLGMVKVEKVKGGLEAIQGALDRLFARVSGTKLVLEL